MSKINFKNVSFIYPESGVKALNNISFNIEIGQSVAISWKSRFG